MTYFIPTSYNANANPRATASSEPPTLTIGAELLVGTADCCAAVVFDLSALEVVFDAPVLEALDAFEVPVVLPEADLEAVPVVLAEAEALLEEDAPDLVEAPLDGEPEAEAEADFEALLLVGTARTFEVMTNWPV